MNMASQIMLLMLSVLMISIGHVHITSGSDWIFGKDCSNIIRSNEVCEKAILNPFEFADGCNKCRCFKENGKVSS